MASLNEEAVDGLEAPVTEGRPAATTELSETKERRRVAATKGIATDRLGETQTSPFFHGQRPSALVAAATLLVAIVAGRLSRDSLFLSGPRAAQHRMEESQRQLQDYRRQRDERWRKALGSLSIEAPPRVFVGEPWVAKLDNRDRSRQRVVLSSWQDAPASTMVRPAGVTRLVHRFTAPGWHTLTLALNGSSRHRQHLRVYVRPEIHPGKTPLPLPPGLTLSSNPADWHLVINIYNDAHQREMDSVYLHGELVQRFLISTGREGHPTPEGTWYVIEKLPEPWSTLYHVPMPYWTGLGNGSYGGLFGLHTLTDASFQYYLGEPASHGCIRHAPRAAMWLYSHVPIGTRVDIVNHKEHH